MALELYHHGTSVCAAKPRIVFGEKGLAWEGHYVDILKGEQLAPGYLKLNPKAVVPTLVHDGKVIRESTLICEYLDETFPEMPLRPKDPYARVEMRMWTKRLDEEQHPNTGPVTYAISHRHAVLQNGPEAVEEYLKSVPPERAERRRRMLSEGIDAPGPSACLLVYDKFLADMETALADRPWLAGDMFSLADVGVIPYVNRLDMLQCAGMWTEHRPRLTDWWERVKARPMFQAALFGFITEDLKTLMREKGAEAWPTVKKVLAEAA